MNKPVMESWKNKIDVVDAVRGGMSEDAKVTLARVLNNTNNALADLRAIKNESVCRDVPASNLSADTWFPEHSIDMVSTIYASQIIEDIVSVQSIDSPVGVIRFLQYTYGQTRGNASRGGLAIDDWGAMRGVAEGRNVACERITEEQWGTFTSGNTYNAQMLPVKISKNTRIDIINQTKSDHPHICAIKNEVGWTCVQVMADGTEAPLSNTSFSCTEDGAMILISTDASVLSASDLLSVSYDQDLSHAPTDSMNLELRIRTEMVHAVPHKIRANFSFDASYALSKAHGINVEESLINACTAEIRQERDNEVINILLRQAGNKREWDRKVTSYISQHEHDMSFISEIFECASLINFETKRAFGNWVVVGRQGLNIIKSAGPGRFTSAGSTMPNNGAFVAGELEGQIKVIYSPYIGQNEYLVGYKGSDMDAGFVVADFLPVTKTDLVMLDDFVGRQGLVSYYGTKMLNPNMYVSGKIVNGELREAKHTV